MERAYWTTVNRATLVGMRITNPKGIRTLRLIIDCDISQDMDISGISIELLGVPITLKLESLQYGLPMGAGLPSERGEERQA
ncbi:MAG: hypothetical protein L0177_19870 [Chloroflexi bacterium]|nr:hypothetical protein [Chloroflexota bacterium]